MQTAKIHLILWAVYLSFLMVPRVVMAQDNPSFVAIRSGVSVPFGKYHQKSLDGGSFTLPGFNITAEGTWFFNQRFGVGLSAGMNLHPVDVSALGYEKVVADTFMIDVYIRSDPYMIITAMGGLFYQQPLLSKLSLTSKVLIGLLWGQAPYQLYKPEYFPIGPDFFEITDAEDHKFSWQIGIGLRYELTPCYALVFDTDLIYDKLTFDFISGAGQRSETRTISFVNTTLGVRFNL